MEKVLLKRVGVKMWSLSANLQALNWASSAVSRTNLNARTNSNPLLLPIDNGNCVLAPSELHFVCP